MKIIGDCPLFLYGLNNPIVFVDPSGNTVMYAVHPDWVEFCASPESEPVKHFYVGVGVSGLVATAVVLAAPVATAAGTSILVAAGAAPATAATASAATVTTTLGVAGAIGTVSTGYNTIQNVKSRNWNAVAYNVGTVVGGLTVGVGGGGRSLSSLNGKPSSVPPSFNPFADMGLGYNPNFPGGSIPGWLASAPSPSSGGFSAMGIGSGIATIPTWSGEAPSAALNSHGASGFSGGSGGAFGTGGSGGSWK